MAVKREWVVGEDYSGTFGSDEGNLNTFGISCIYPDGIAHINAVEVYTSAEDRETILTALQEAEQGG